MTPMMEDILTPISHTYQKPAGEGRIPGISDPKKRTASKKGHRPTSPEEALDVLKSEPDYDALNAVLKYLDASSSEIDGFNIAAPSPQSAPIIQALVFQIIPNYWTILQEGFVDSSSEISDDAEILIRCLRNVSAVKILILRLTAQVREYKEKQSNGVDQLHLASQINLCLAVLSALLAIPEAVQTIWRKSSAGSEERSRRRILAQEFVSLFGSGRIVSVCAEAHTLTEKTPPQSAWMSDGHGYSRWLARAIVAWLHDDPSKDAVKTCSELLAKAMRMGYSGTITNTIFADLLLGSKDGTSLFSRLLADLPPLDQKRLLHALLTYLANHLPDSDSDESVPAPNPKIAAAAGCIHSLIQGDSLRTNHVVSWLTSSPGAGMGQGLGIRRAVIAALSLDNDVLTTTLETLMNLVGDQLYIRHTPLLQQEVHTQALLLLAGYTHRVSPLKLSMCVRSGTYLSMVSNRLGATQTKARLLGMVVGETLSSLVHKGETKLDFHADELSTEGAKRYRDLIYVQDKIGPIDPLLSHVSSNTPPSLNRSTVPTTSRRGPPKRPEPAQPTKTHPLQTSKPGLIRPVIEEIDDSESEDDDIKPYAKPDSDAEDSDEDPTLIRRDKARPPVYIRDLISYFRDTENYDKQKLALTTAPVLIRRKAQMGTELREHAHELASIIVGLQDTYELENFHGLQLQVMISLVVSEPKSMAPWFCKTFFDGDYSVSQRVAVLAVLGLSAREISGYDTSEYSSEASFPSKKLPARLEKLYLEDNPGDPFSQPTSSASLKALPRTALDNISRSLTTSFLEPLAAKAADSATGPDVLKLSTFTSRQKSNQKTRESRVAKVRAVPNTTSTLIYAVFFTPLTAPFPRALRAPRTTASGLVLHSFLLSTYLKTLAVLVHSAGPTTLNLSDMTAELWDLLLAVRTHCAGDVPSTTSWLAAVAALLEINVNEMQKLCSTHGRAVLETQEWVGTLLEHSQDNPSPQGEEADLRMLAAGVLMRIREAVEKYQMMMLGDLVGFM